MTLNETIKQGARKSHANVIFSDTMLERRLIENIVNEHTLLLYGCKRFFCNGQNRQAFLPYGSQLPMRNVNFLRLPNRPEASFPHAKFYFTVERRKREGYF